MYCQARPHDVNQHVLTQLTHASIMPAVKPQEAGYLLGLAIQHDADSLRARCVEAMSHEWETTIIPALNKQVEPAAKRKKTDKNSTRETKPSPLCMDVPDEVKLELLAGALCSAHKELAAERAEHSQVCAVLTAQRERATNTRGSSYGGGGSSYGGGGGGFGYAGGGGAFGSAGGSGYAGAFGSAGGGGQGW